jgi:pectinesterase
MQNISLRVRGRGMKKTILSGSLCASMQMENGEKRGTFRSYTAFFGGPSVRLENLSIENTSGLPDKKGRKAGQAIALYADASCMYCKRVGLYGHQDTLFTAPLPQKEKIPGGFTGPGKDKERKPSIQIYTRCDIEGTIDFIFGGAGCFVDHSRITIRPLYPKDNEPDSPAVSYIAAPGGDTPLELGDHNPGAAQSGFVFNRCQVRKTKDCNAQSVFLARPWRPYARCVYISCNFGRIIDEKIWDNWNDEENEKTVFFGEYKGTGLKKTDKKRIEGSFGIKLTRIQKREILSQFKPFV